MATKKQKREAAFLRRQQFDAETRRLGLEAQKKSARDRAMDLEEASQKLINRKQA